MKNYITFANFHGNSGKLTLLEKYLGLKFGDEFQAEKLPYYINKIIQFNKNNSTESPIYYDFMVLNSGVLFVDKNGFKN